MKKTILLIFLIIFLSAAAFAADITRSAGGGGLLGYSFSRYTFEGGAQAASLRMDRVDYAGLLFFDMFYGEISVVVQGGSNSYSENIIYDDPAASVSKGTGVEMSLGFGILVKYPFRITERFYLFPLLGLEYQIALLQRRRPEGDKVHDRTKGDLPEDMTKDGELYPLTAWDSWKIDVGAGVDYFLTDKLFLRGELLFGFRLPTSYEAGLREAAKNPPMNAEDPKLTGLTGGPFLKIAVGYCF